MIRFVLLKSRQIYKPAGVKQTISSKFFLLLSWEVKQNTKWLAPQETVSFVSSRPQWFPSCSPRGASGLYAYTTATAWTTPSKNCFYFTLEFLFYLDLSSASVGIKTCPCWICYECVKFQIEIRKISRFGSRSPNHAEFGHFTLWGRQRNVTKNYKARAQLLFAH